MENADYHALTSVVSKSHLDLVARSPLHYWARYVDPKRVEPEPTAAMLLGTAVHTLVLEADQFADRYVAAPEGIDRRYKAGKELFAEWEAQAAGRTVLTKADADLIQAMGRAVHGHPAAAYLLGLPGKAETTHMWTDEATGLECKCRPDWLLDDSSLIVDLKTTEDASPAGFSKSIANFRYHVQASWYLDGLERATGRRPEQFVFCVVEKRPPHAVAVYAADAEMVAAGQVTAARDMLLLAECRDADYWPAYSDQIETISLPAWMRPRADGSVPVAPAEQIETF
jgi:exodeoxyribonuclease VIII